MPINAYVGLMGSGKSYEVVSTVICDAIAAGRRVVANVDGLDLEAIHLYCHEKYGTPLEKLGTILKVSNDEVKEPNFLCHGLDVDTVVKPGDLVCIDEAWRFWGTDCKIHETHKIFFREHRHYAHPETKVTCDLVVMVQDIGDLHRILRYVVEMTFKTHKLKSLGLNNNYRVDLYEGYKLAIKSRINSIQKRYDKKVFPLYSSYSGGKGKEKAIDKRQNILLDKKFIFGGIFTVLLLGYTIPAAWKMFHPEMPASTATTPGMTTSTQGGAVAVPAQVETESVWRIVGLFGRTTGETLVFLVDEAGVSRTVIASAFVLDDFMTEGFVDGKKVAYWTGQKPKASFIGESK